jgi:hypothetical protein
MRPLTTTAALAAAAMSLLASPGATRHPIAVTHSALAAVSAARPGSAEPACHEPTDAHSGAAREHTVSDISWFQGTLEEAFTRHAHKDHRPLLHF